MNLILWRHAEAEDAHGPARHGADADLARALTKHGKQQARLAAAWLRAHLPGHFTLLASPARRTVETACALDEKYETVEALAPGGDASALLAAAGWPDGIDKTVVIVGHQPTIGRAASLLMTGSEQEWSVRKSAVWWFAARERGDDAQVVLRAVMDSDWG